MVVDLFYLLVIVKLFHYAFFHQLKRRDRRTHKLLAQDNFDKYEGINMNY